MMTGSMYLLQPRSVTIAPIKNIQLMKPVMASLIIVLASLISILFNSDQILLYAGNISLALSFILYGRREVHPMLLAILIHRLQKVYSAMHLLTRQKIYS